MAGKLAMSARPRGGDWLKDDVAKWREAGIDTVLSLLTADEERDLDLRDEAVEVGRQRMEFSYCRSPGSQVRSAIGRRIREAAALFRRAKTSWCIAARELGGAD
jgi:hypothetical protein